MKVTYGDAFYAEMKDTNLFSARVAVPLVLELLGPIRSVVDVGCGRGLWLQAFSENGVADIFGVDGVWVQPENLSIPPKSFESRDFEKPFSIGRTADLVLSVEVAEHITATHADAFVKALVDVAPVVLFLAAIPGQGGTDHRNEQWPEYWVEKFAHHGYVPVDALRRKLWNDVRVSFFYAQNMIVFVKSSELVRFPNLQREIECGFGAVPTSTPISEHFTFKLSDPPGSFLISSHKVASSSPCPTPLVVS